MIMIITLDTCALRWEIQRLRLIKKMNSSFVDVLGSGGGRSTQQF